MAKQLPPKTEKPHYPMGTLFFAMPSWMSGIAHLFDFGQSMNEYNFGLTPEQSDRLAMQSDWNAVGEDMRTAIHQVMGEQYKLHNKPRKR